MNSFLPLRKAYVRCAATAVLCGSTELCARNDWLILPHHAKPRERDFQERQFEQQERPFQLESASASLKASGMTITGTPGSSPGAAAP